MLSHYIFQKSPKSFSIFHGFAQNIALLALVGIVCIVFKHIKQYCFFVFIISVEAILIEIMIFL